MSSENKIHICLIIPSLASGGMERVMVELAHFLSLKSNVKLSMITLTNSNSFYTIPQNMDYYEPEFLIKQSNRLVSLFKTFFYVRRTLKKIQPDVLLSFGGKYNSFVLAASSGLKINTFISDRSKPTISYGFFLDFLNPILYKYSTGIIAQTEIAKNVLYKKTSHNNIVVIPNPVKIPIITNDIKENYILNVGRFVATKQQELLIEYFAKILPENPNWKVVFLGDGPLLTKVKEKAIQLNIQNNVQFIGATENIEMYYRKSSIFAFTSISEGFPNALLEAMSYNLACISFDCSAGPTELIDDGSNGYLIPEENHELYIERLKTLMTDNELRFNFANLAREKAKRFNIENIGESFYNVLVHKN